MHLVPIPSPGETLYYGTPGDPVVVIIHDMYGRLPGLDPLATALSGRGFRVAVLDLYDGVCTIDTSTAEELRDRLDLAHALASVKETTGTAQELGTEKVGLVGFGSGGRLALRHAQHGAADAVVAYYSSLSGSEHGIIPCPVLLQWAEVDAWPADTDPAVFVNRLTQHGTPATQYTYLATERYFANSSLPDRINGQAAALAFARTTVFLDTHLSG
jgi:carboxymethylenebutenolidase